MKLSQDQIRAVLSAVQAGVPSDYGYYLILCPKDLDRSKVVGVGNLNQKLVPELLRAMAASHEHGVHSEPIKP